MYIISLVLLWILYLKGVNQAFLQLILSIIRVPKKKIPLGTILFCLWKIVQMCLLLHSFFFLNHPSFEEFRNEASFAKITWPAQFDSPLNRNKRSVKLHESARNAETLALRHVSRNWRNYLSDAHGPEPLPRSERLNTNWVFSLSLTINIILYYFLYPRYCRFKSSFPGYTSYINWFICCSF